MPRIDPQQLLSCLTPLLAVNGGIKSSGEVIRLANLMEKYSKKLVSKCIYIQILKCTETDLLGQFMAAGGWNLVHTWLNDGVNSSNWPFVQEILEMLLLCPVDGNRLKSNHTPKIVKNLSLNLSQNAIITALSKKLVEQWLKIAHQEKQILQQQQQNGVNGTITFKNIDADDKNLLNNDLSMIKNDTDVKISSSNENVNSNNNNNNNSNSNNINGTLEEDSPKKSSENVKYKISNKESGLVLSIKRSTSPITETDAKLSKSLDSKSKSENKSKSSSSSDKDRSKKSSSSSSHKSSSKTSHKDKDKDRSSSNSHKSSSSSSSSSSKDRHKESSSKSSSSSKHSSSSSSRDKDRDREKRKRELEKEQAEKDKETLSFLAPLSSSKLQRIPKRPHSENSENKSDSDSSSKSAKPNEVIEKKKPSISIEVRKGDKPKTVKTLNSQFRDHGLAEDPPPPPSRKALKKPLPQTSVILPISTTSSSNHSTKPISPPPSKKLHLDKALEPDVPERIGGVKLIKPKPMLFESTGFLDALNDASAITKKDSKKRKRLPSGSSSSKKDEPESPKIEVKPLKFYKDTLEDTTEEEKTNGTSSASPTKDIENDNKNSSSADEKTIKGEESKSDENVEKSKSDETSEVKEEEPEEKRPPGTGTGPDGPPGIISDPNFPRRKKAKRSIRWRKDDELTDIRYFELDENERVNVTKTFNEQKQDEHNRERMMLRTKVVELTEWQSLKLIDNVPDIAYGSKSQEAAIQAERERNTLQEMFFNNRSTYDSPHEADPEEYDILEPAIIPLDDVTGNPDSVNNFKDVQWPAPKGDQPQYISQGGFGSLFGNLNLVSNITIPPATVNPTINPLAGFNLAGLNTPAIPQETAAINFMGIGMIPPQALPSPFMHQPPPIIQNNYQSNINYQNRGGSSGNSNNYNRNNYNDRNRMGSNNSSSGSNWVRGNATLRRGMCHQYQRTGFCRNQKTGCPYIHER